MQLLQRLKIAVSLKPGASKVALFQYITEAFLSYCRTDRKILLASSEIKTPKDIYFPSLIPVKVSINI